jgi:carbon monoxide dehydrogenase subunit G
MELRSSFTVHAPVERVWATLMDIERVAGCLPGAEVLGKMSEDAYQLGVKVKLGPVTMAYRGNLDVAQRDEVNHRAVLSGQAKETRGQGTAKATATMTLTEVGGVTTGVIDTDLSLSGKAAAMGKSVIGSVSEQLMKQFANNLQSMIDEPAEGGSTDAPAGEPAAAVPAAEPVKAAETIAAPAGERSWAPPASPTPDRTPDDNSLDGLALAGKVVLGQLSDPKKLGALFVMTAAVAYLIGRRSGRTGR